MVAAAEHGTRSVLVGWLAHAAIAGATVAAHLVTGSTATLAAAGTSLAAAAGHLLLLRAVRRTRRQTDDLLPAGSSRSRYFWSFAVTAVLLVVGAVLAVDEGLRLVRADRLEHLTEPVSAYGALGGGALLALVALVVAVRQGDRERGRATWRHYLRNARTPEVPVVIVLAAWSLAALAVAAGAVAATDLAEQAQADGIGTSAAGALMGLLALVLMVEMRSLLLGASAGRKDVETIRAAVEVDPAVRELIDMRTQHQGPDELLVGMRVELDHELTFPEVSEVVNRLERNVRRAVPMARTMFIEPDVTVARRAAPTIDEHVPVHAVPEPIRARQRRADGLGALGVGIPVEDER